MTATAVPAGTTFSGTRLIDSGHALSAAVKNGDWLDGGIALLDNTGLLGSSIGQTFDNCTIALPDIGVVTTSLQIRHVLEVPMLNNKTHRRVGMQFADMPRAGLSAVQRYITRLERERNARLAGLA